MRKLLLTIFFITNLFSYEKTTDNTNIYFSSEHFRVIAGIGYIDDGLVNKILDAAEQSWSVLVDTNNFNKPNFIDNSVVDLYIANTGAINIIDNGYEVIDSDMSYCRRHSCLFGYAWDYTNIDRKPFIVLNKYMWDDAIKVTVGHEFFHTIQFTYFNEVNISYDKWNKNIWWLEATSTLMEDEVYNDINDYITVLYDFFNDSSKSFELYDGSHEYSMVIFAKYIKEKYGIQIIKDALSNIEISGDNGYFEILDELLIKDHNSSMKISLNEFAKWVSNPSKYFEEGLSYPPLRHFTVSDNITIEKGGIKVVDNLSKGWNMVALSNTTIDKLYIPNMNYIWTYKDGVWYNNILNSNNEQIDEISSDKGYWVLVDDTSYLYYTYYDNTQIDISTLSEGWHFLGTTQEINIDTFDTAQTVWQYSDNSWSVYSNEILSSEQSEYKTIEKINPYTSYWINYN